MRTRKWKLPGVQDLTKDQEAALAYPSKGQHLIIGGPGTGKTVVMVMRAIQLQRQEVMHVFLVYNHMLHQASQQMAGEEFESSTYERWFWKKFREYTGKPVPMQEEHPSNWKPIDWKACVREANEILIKWNSSNGKEFLIIDEGQDMAPGFYHTLIALGFENFFVAADQNQQIRADQNSSIQDIQNALAIEPADVIELKHNFRNNYGIARLAREFYTGNPASPPPDLPDRKGGIHIPKLYTFGNQPGIYITIARRIVRTFLRDDRKLLGVITPNNEVRKIYLDALAKAKNFSNKNSVPIYTYDSNNKQEVLFNQGGIVVLNAQSCKGLEFNTVILADIHKYKIFDNDQDDTKKLFYVMISRARDAVFLLIKRGNSKQIENLLPESEEVLKREELSVNE